MDCQDAEKLLHAYVDDELDVTRSLEMDEHLRDCAGCAQAYADLQALRKTLQSDASYFRAPSALQKRIQASVRNPSRAGTSPRVSARLGLAVAASLVLGLIAGWSLRSVQSSRPATAFLAQALVASHVRSQMLSNHLVDVRSSDQHQIKPFFEGKVDFALPVAPDLKDQDFQLIGARLDYLDNRAVAVLVYKRREHLINLYIWPSTPGAETLGAEAVIQEVTRQGYHLLRWTQSDMTYWAVSNLNERELQAFARLIQEKAG